MRDQIVTQLELKILGGSLAHGSRLPSVRALARRLNVHHNTVSAAYQDLRGGGPRRAAPRLRRVRAARGPELRWPRPAASTR